MILHGRLARTCWSYSLPFVLLAFLASNAGLLRAGLNSWTHSGPDEYYVQSLLIDPLDPKILYASTTRGLIRSTDHGVNWELMLPGEGWPMLIPQHDPSILYYPRFSTMRRSTDRGETWLSYSAPGEITCLAVDPWNSDTLLAGVNGRMLKSVDKGESWTVLPGWTVPQTFFDYTDLLTAHPLLKDVFFAAGVWGLYRSNDGGASWTKLPEAGPTIRMAFHPTDPKCFYAGYNTPRWTKDGGLTFRPLDPLTTFTDLRAILVDPNQPQIVYIGGADVYSTNCFFRATDGGSLWYPIVGGIEEIPVHGLVADRLNPQMIWACTVGGIYQSTDHGQSWRTALTGLMTGRQQSSMEIDPSNGRLYAMSEITSTTPRLRVNVSDDRGATWRRNDWALDAFAVDPNIPGTLYAATATQFFKSTDHGATWKASVNSPPGVRQIRLVPGRPDLAFAIGATYPEGSLWRSLDSGLSWNVVQYHRFRQTTVWNLAFSQDGKTVFAADDGGWLHKSTDEGLSWQECPVNDPPGFYGDVQLDPGNKDHVYIRSRAGQGAYESRDGGATWTRIPGLPDNITCLGVDTRFPAFIMAGTDSGLLLSEDRGATWSLLNAGFAKGPITAVRLDPGDPRRIYGFTPAGILCYTREPVAWAPRLSSTDGQIGLAFANTGSIAATVTLTALTGSGTSLLIPGGQNPVGMELGAAGQLARIDTEAFATTAENLGEGWLRSEVSVPGCIGMFSWFNADLSMLDTWAMPRSPSRFQLLPELSVDGFARVHLANPGQAPLDVRMQLIGEEGKVRATSSRIRVPARGMTVQEVKAAFPGTDLAASDYMALSADRPFLAFEFFGHEGKAVGGLEALDGERSSRLTYDGLRHALYLPQFVLGDALIRSVVTLINVGDSKQWVYWTLVDEEGKSMAAGDSVQLAAGSKIVLDDRRMFPTYQGPTRTGSLRVLLSGGQNYPNIAIVGQVAFQDEKRQQLLTALPMVIDLSPSYLLGHLASGESFFTGIALMNTDPVDVQVDLRAFSPDGTELASTTVVLAPNGRRSLLLAEYFPTLGGKEIAGGYVKVAASRPIACFGIYAPRNMSSLAMIPGQTLQ